MAVTVFTRNPISVYAISTEAIISYLNLQVKLENATGDEKPSALFEKLFDENNRFTPALYDDSKKLAINQAVAVNRYLLSLAKDTKGLEGKAPEDKSEILQWSNRVDSDIWKTFKSLIVAKFSGKTVSQKEVDELVASAPAKGFASLEAHLKKNTFLVGEQLTLADVEAAGLLFVPFTFFVNAEWQKNHPAIVRWANTVLNGKVYQKKFGGKFAFSKNGDAATFYSPEFGKPVQKSAPKADKPADKPAEQAKKPSHPLADLGRSSIPIDELKRTYSNKETREEALPWFWNTFYNDEEWSLWKVDYKYNDELTMTFMSNNLIGGFFNRLSASTKFIFGAAVVYGENNNNGIRGAFVVRGKEFEPAFDVAPDYESFSFTRIDPSNEADREELADLWAWDKPLIVNGEKREIVDGKVFK